MRRFTNTDETFLLGLNNELEDLDWRLRNSQRAVGCFSAYKSVDQNDIPVNTWVKVTFETKNWDVSGWYDAATSKFTPQRAGYYRLTAAVNFETGTEADKDYILVIWKNGGGEKWLGRLHTAAILPLLISGSAITYANGTTDYFEIYARTHQADDTADISGAFTARTYFQGEFIGTAP